MHAGDHVLLADGQHAVVQSEPDWRDCIDIIDDAGQRYAVGVSAVAFHTAPAEPEAPVITDEQKPIVSDHVSIDTVAVPGQEIHLEPAHERPAAPVTTQPEPPAQAAQEEAPHAQP